MELEEIKFLIAISGIPQIGPARVKVLIDVLKSPSEIWNATEAEIKEILGPKTAQIFLDSRKNLDPDELYQNVKKSNIQVLTLWDKDYPKLLKQIPDPPPILYYKGNIEKISNKSLAIVGTRKPTLYGREVTEHFAKQLASQRFNIVSGLARGVDAIAHKSTLDHKGFTVAVLGGGLNRIYPLENKTLSEKVSSNGLLLSEFPPDFPPNPGTFPARNRIISGLSLGVLITEAAEDSGSLITADCALEQNREVFAVPGPVFSKLSAGTAKLIKQGAKLVTGVSDILDELGFEQSSEVISNFQPTNQLQKDVLDLLANERVHIDDIVRNLKSNSSEVSSTLSILEIQGVVKNLGSGYYHKIR